MGCDTLTKNNIFYIYVYLDPRKPGNFKYGKFKFKFEPFYVGKGGTKRQIKRHLYEAKNNNIKNSIKFYKIKHILNLELEPIIIKLHENLLELEAYKIESEMINKIGRVSMKTGPLANINDGGRGGCHNPPEELRAKYSKATKGKTYEEIYGKKKAKILKKKRIESNKKREIRKLLNTARPERAIKLNKNIKKLFNQNLIKNPKTYKLTNHNNEYVITKNLKATCDFFKLHPGYICGLVSGKTEYYKGWKCEVL